MTNTSEIDTPLRAATLKFAAQKAAKPKPVAPTATVPSVATASELPFHSKRRKLFEDKIAKLRAKNSKF